MLACMALGVYKFVIYMIYGNCYKLGCQRLMMELLGLMVVMLEGLGFNLCVVPFLNICVPNLPQG